MASLSTAPIGKHKIDGNQVLLKDPTDYLIETLSLPTDQPLPGKKEKYFEFCEIILAADMGAGKTYTIDNELAPIAKKIWRDQIDFYDAQDISGTIEAIWKSEKLVHFIKIDDAVKRGSDSRQSMSKKNISGTQKFFIIRHLAKRGLLGAGYLILVFATQDLHAIDKRIRNHAAIVLLKSYVDGIEEFLKPRKIPKKILDTLYYLSDNARRRHRNDIRKIGIAVDVRGKFHMIITEKANNIEKIEWIKIEEGITLRIQTEDLINFTLGLIIEYFNAELHLNNSELKGFMRDELYLMQSRYAYCEVDDVHFPEVIESAKARFKKMIKDGEIISPKIEIEKEKNVIIEKKKELRHKQYHELSEFSLELLKKYNTITLSELKGALIKKLNDFEKKYDSCEIKEKDFRGIIFTSSFEYKKYKINLEKIKKQEKKIPGGWDDNRLLILHDTMNLSFEAIEERFGIPHTTAHRRYKKIKKLHENALKALDKQEIEIEG